MEVEAKARLSELIIQSLKKGAKQIDIGFEQQRSYGIENIQQEEVYREALEILHNHSRNGIVNFKTIGPVTDYKMLPPIEITGIGKEYLETDEIPVYDPDEYLKEIQASVSNIDPIIFEYIKESIRAFNRECTMSSAIALGVASERMIQMLYESLKNAFKEPSDKKKLQKVEDQSIFKKHSALEDMLKEKIRLKLLPKELTENWDVYMSSLFHLMRLYRNEFGHPTGAKVEKSVVRVFLKSFGVYLIRLYSLKEYLDSMPDKIKGKQ
ncbi:MAG TPA: hypothetical protein PKH33_14020 [bacterium]|nr:hypothetical protein [bacterium]